MMPEKKFTVLRNTFFKEE